MHVMTQNMDEATDFGPVLTATSIQTLLGAVTATYLEVQASKISERAVAVAREIGEQRPTLVGLQEVSHWRTGPFNAPPATTVAFDQLQALLDTLNQQGLHYAPIGIRTGLDAEAPSTLGFDMRVTDRDVMLVRTDLPASKLKVLNVQVQNFATNVVVPNSLLGNLASPPAPCGSSTTVAGLYSFLPLDPSLTRGLFRTTRRSTTLCRSAHIG